MPKRLACLLMGGLAAILAAVPAGASTVIRISTWTPPSHFVNTAIWATWSGWVGEATQGRVRTRIEYNLASPFRQFGVVRDGIADVGWVFHGYNTRYVATQIVEIPNLGTSAEAASVAYWKVHEKYLHKAKEHRGTVLLALMAHGPAVIQTKKPVKRLSDLRRMKIRVPGGVGSQIGRALGVTAVKLPGTKVYEALSSGVADGTFMPMESQLTLRLSEVVPHVLTMPGGLYHGSFALIANPAALNKLSAADRKALMDASGARLSQFAGVHWDAMDRAGRAAAHAGGTTIRVAGASMKERFLRIVRSVEEAWIERASEAGYDARAALAELRRLARAYDEAR